MKHNPFTNNFARRDFMKMTAGLAASLATGNVLSAKTVDLSKIRLGLDGHSMRGMRWKAPQLTDYAATLKLDAVLFNGLQYFESLDKNYLLDLKKKADSYAKYNEAAIYQMLIEAMPELARAVSEPLSRVEKIVMVGDGASGASKLTGQVTSIVAQLPTIVESLSGVDMKKILKKLNIAEDKKDDKKD